MNKKYIKEKYNKNKDENKNSNDTINHYSGRVKPIYNNDNYLYLWTQSNKFTMVIMKIDFFKLNVHSSHGNTKLYGSKWIKLPRNFQ